MYCEDGHEQIPTESPLTDAHHDRHHCPLLFLELFPYSLLNLARFLLNFSVSGRLLKPLHLTTNYNFQGGIKVAPRHEDVRL